MDPIYQTGADIPNGGVVITRAAGSVTFHDVAPDETTVEATYSIEDAAVLCACSPEELLGGATVRPGFQIPESQLPELAEFAMRYRAQKKHMIASMPAWERQLAAAR